MHNVSDMSLPQLVSQQQMDALSSPIVIPASKLDADQYVAEDLDGVTETLFGSGNLNFLMMQAGQTNESLMTMDFSSPETGELPLSSGLVSSSTFSSSSDFLGSDFSYGSIADDAPADSLPAINAGSVSDALTNDVSTGATFNDSLRQVNYTAGRNGSGFSGVDGADAQNGTSGVDGLNGLNGIDGTGGGDTLIDIDINNDQTINLGDITNIFNDLFEGGLTLHLDAILSPITSLDLDLISGDTITNLLNPVIDLSSVTDLLEPIIDLDGLVLADLHSIFTLFQDGEHEHRAGDTDVGLGLDVITGDLPLLNGVTDIALNPVEDLVGDIDILADLGLDLFDTSAIDNNAGDSDLTLDLGIDALDGEILNGGLDIPLDPVEAIVGDIDLDIGAAADLLGQAADLLVDGFDGGSDSDNLVVDIGDGVADLAGQLLPGLSGGDENTPDITADADVGVLDQQVADLDIDEMLDPVEPLIGDAEADTDIGLDLLGGNETDNAAGDTDIDTDLDLDLLGQDVVEIDLIDVPLDPVEELTGDIDLGLNAALDLLNSDADDGGVNDLLDNEAGSDTILGNWTENDLPDAGDLFGDGDQGLGSILPEPVGDIGEGLGGLLGGGDDLSGGGLFGGHQGGGLFG